MTGDSITYGNGPKRVRVWLETSKRGTIEELNDGSVIRSKEVISPEYAAFKMAEAGWRKVTK